MKKILLLLPILVTLYAQTQEEFRKTQLQAFENYKQTQLGDFTTYKAQQKKAYNEYVSDIGKIWVKPKMSTKTKWISYSKDKKTRSNVDFKNKTITLQVISKSPQEAEQKLKIALAKAVTIDTKKAQESDPLEKILARIKKPKEVKDSPVDAKPILATVIFDKKPTQKSVALYVNKHIQSKNIKKIISKKSHNEFVYTVKVKLPKDTTIKRSKIYYDEIEKQSSKQGIPLSLTFAIMHSESNFNPHARSYVPAFGLMQLVPKTAGIDAYRYLYKKKRLVSANYLYNSTNNITMGTAYLHILYYRYLRKIKNPQSRLYCTIAAYNTGAGNIAYAFTRTHNMSKAAPYINKLTPAEVYEKLLRDLRYDEPKKYLKIVSKRMNGYHKIYEM